MARKTNKLFLDKAITLIKTEVKTIDLIEREVEVSRRVIDASEKSITRSEFYRSQDLKIRPKKVFVMNRDDWEGETLFIDEDGRHFSYIRDFIVSDYGRPMIEITVEEKIKDTYLMLKENEKNV